MVDAACRIHNTRLRSAFHRRYFEKCALRHHTALYDVKRIYRFSSHTYLYLGKLLIFKFSLLLSLCLTRIPSSLVPLLPSILVIFQKNSLFKKHKSDLISDLFCIFSNTYLHLMHIGLLIKFFMLIGSTIRYATSSCVCDTNALKEIDFFRKM